MRLHVTFLAGVAGAAAVLSGPLRAADVSPSWHTGEIRLRARAGRPVLTVTAEELARLRAAYRSKGPAASVVASMVRQADAAMKAELTFPPRGGQHNQWYQCDRCQIALRTVSPTRHQCPRCGKVYTGEPYDDVVYSRVHYRNLRGAHAAAWAWALTGRRNYADHAAKVLLGYAARYTKYPYHSASRSTTGWAGRSGGHLFEQTLTEASALAEYIAPACDLVWDAPALTGPQRDAIRTGLLQPMLANIARNPAGKSNWQTWHNAAMLWGGAVVGDAAWVRRALADPKNGFARQMEISVTPEGMWYENSWGYHFYTLRAMVLIAEGARRLGIDVWSHPTLARMFTVAVDYAMPDGTLPRFGDDVNTRVTSASAYLEYLYHAHPAPALVPHLPRGPTWDSILLGRSARAKAPPARPTSKVFAGAGHAILRTPGPAAQAAVITFGPYGGFHGHYDKLSFVYFAHGRELGTDPGRARSQAYRLPIHRHWYKATISHNTVLVDGASQKPAAGVLERFAANDRCALALAHCDGAYPPLRHRRLLVLTQEYLLVCDALRPAPAGGKAKAPAGAKQPAAPGKPRPGATKHQFDWVYHSRGKSVACPAATKAGDLPKDLHGREYVRNIRSGRTEGTVRVVFRDTALATHVTLAGQEGTAVHIGEGVGASVLDRVPLVLVRRPAPPAHFAAVLEPVAAGAKPTVTDVLDRPGAKGAREIIVLRGSARDTITLGPDSTVTVRRGGQPVLAAP